MHRSWSALTLQRAPTQRRMRMAASGTSSGAQHIVILQMHMCISCQVTSDIGRCADLGGRVNITKAFLCRCTEQFQPFSKDGKHDMYWPQASSPSSTPARKVLQDIPGGLQCFGRLPRDVWGPRCSHFPSRSRWRGVSSSGASRLGPCGPSWSGAGGAYRRHPTLSSRTAC